MTTIPPISGAISPQTSAVDTARQIQQQAIEQHIADEGQARQEAASANSERSGVNISA